MTRHSRESGNTNSWNGSNPEQGVVRKRPYIYLVCQGFFKPSGTFKKNRATVLFAGLSFSGKGGPFMASDLWEAGKRRRGRRIRSLPSPWCVGIDIEQDASRLRRFFLEKLLIIFIDISRFPDPLTQVACPALEDNVFHLAVGGARPGKPQRCIRIPDISHGTGIHHRGEPGKENINLAGLIIRLPLPDIPSLG